MLKPKEILPRLLSQAGLRKAVEAAAREYCSITYRHRSSPLTYTSGDGMARHSEFNRTIADFLTRYGREDGIRYIPKLDDDVTLIGNIVHYNPHKGQPRFTVNLGGEVYQLLLITGELNGDHLSVAGIGNARREYFENQNSSIPPANLWSLFADGTPVAGADGEVDTRPYRILLVTELRGPDRNDFALWACLSDGQYDAAECIISIVDKHLLLDGKVFEIGSTMAVTAREDEEAVVDFEISPRGSLERAG